MIKRDLKADLIAHQLEERHGHRFGAFIQDIVYGGIDGIVTTFAVVAASAGAGLSTAVIIIVGLANLFADASSMGIGSFLSLRSEKDQHKRLRKEEFQEIEDDPEIEREEIREAFAKKGFKGADLDRVVEVITSDKEIWVKTMMQEEHGISGEEAQTPLQHGSVTFGAFILFGSIPLLPYLLPVELDNTFQIAIIGTFVALALLGLTRSIVTRENPWRGPLEIMVLGLLAAGIAYGVGVFLRSISGV